MGYAIIEMIGEWNDAIENDIMTFKRDIIDIMIKQGINKYILVAENVLNFHSSDDCYYEEWMEDIEEEGGWVAIIGLPEQSRYDFTRANIDRYVQLIDLPEWRPFTPGNLFTKVDNILLRRLNN
jgi:MFS superfamily sulfate permease-like transporter